MAADRGVVWNGLYKNVKILLFNLQKIMPLRIEINSILLSNKIYLALQQLEQNNILGNLSAGMESRRQSLVSS